MSDFSRAQHGLSLDEMYAKLLERDVDGCVVGCNFDSTHKFIVIGPPAALCDKILGFCSGKEVQCDGTHGMAPGLLSYHFLCEGILLFQVIHARNTKDTYIPAFQLIADKFPAFSPGCFVLDGERPAHDALDAAWSGVPRYLCSLHVWRHWAQQLLKPDCGGDLKARLIVICLLHDLLFEERERLPTHLCGIENLVAWVGTQQRLLAEKEQHLALVCGILRAEGFKGGFLRVADYLENTYGPKGPYCPVRWAASLRPVGVSLTTNPVEAFHRATKSFGTFRSLNAFLCEIVDTHPISVAVALRRARLRKDKGVALDEAKEIPNVSVVLRGTTVLRKRKDGTLREGIDRPVYYLCGWLVRRKGAAWVAQREVADVAPTCSKEAAVAKVAEMERLRRAPRTKRAVKFGWVREKKPTIEKIVLSQDKFCLASRRATVRPSPRTLDPMDDFWAATSRLAQARGEKLALVVYQTVSAEVNHLLNKQTYKLASNEAEHLLIQARQKLAAAEAQQAEVVAATERASLTNARKALVREQNNVQTKREDSTGYKNAVAAVEKFSQKVAKMEAAAAASCAVANNAVMTAQKELREAEVRFLQLARDRPTGIAKLHKENVHVVLAPKGGVEKKARKKKARSEAERLAMTEKIPPRGTKGLEGMRKSSRLANGEAKTFTGDVDDSLAAALDNLDSYMGD